MHMYFKISEKKDDCSAKTTKIYVYNLYILKLHEVLVQFAFFWSPVATTNFDISLANMRLNLARLGTGS